MIDGEERLFTQVDFVSEGRSEVVEGAEWKAAVENGSAQQILEELSLDNDELPSRRQRLNACAELRVTGGVQHNHLGC